MRPLRLFPAILVAACGGGSSAPDARLLDGRATDAPLADAVPVDATADAATDAPPAPDAAPPMMLSQTGLYTDTAAKTLAPGVRAFTPRWVLWSDDAAKQSWIWLPPGAQIDTSDADFWSFPQGTKLWKEFVRNGQRIETRYLEKIGAGNAWTDWFAVSFEWDPTEQDATAVPAGVIDATGTNDIPSRNECRQCHTDARVPSVVIGFSALQLDVPSSDPTVLNLGALVTEGRLTAPPTNPVAGVYVPLPADDVARDALGYLHANCGNCHNPRSEVHAQVGLVLRQDLGHLRTATAWSQTLAYTTTVGVAPQHAVSGATAIVEPGAPTTSALHLRLTSTGGQRMPPLGRETVDPLGAETVRAWIAALPQ
ncbi:MAG: hypothetical protein K8W52_02270 [Deltaproteobacteria bacterium]|nr:hypothetical protein [Deltaproteobacteria bacterium]